MDNMSPEGVSRCLARPTAPPELGEPSISVQYDYFPWYFIGFPIVICIGKSLDISSF